MDQNTKTPMYKRVLAMAGIIILLAMYLVLVVEAFLGSPETYNIFIGCVAATIALPILLWLLIWAIGAITGRHTVASLDPLSSNKRHDKYGNVIPEGKVDTVVFDIGGVLVDFAWDEFLKNKGCSDEMVKRIGKATTESEDWVQYDIGSLTNDEIVELFCENDPGIADEIRRCFADLTDIVLKRERTIPWIESLKASGYRVLYLSNFSSQALGGCPEAMGFLDYTDGGILSFRDHVVKPYPEIYKLLEERFDLVPEKTVFIDDTKANIDAAIERGWNGIVYKEYGQVRDELHALGVTY